MWRPPSKKILKFWFRSLKNPGKPLKFCHCRKVGTLLQARLWSLVGQDIVLYLVWSSIHLMIFIIEGLSGFYVAEIQFVSHLWLVLLLARESILFHVSGSTYIHAHASCPGFRSCPAAPTKFAKIRTTHNFLTFMLVQLTLFLCWIPSAGNVCTKRLIFY